MKKYWRSLDEQKNTSTFKLDEKSQEIDHKTSFLEIINDDVANKKSTRRNFLKMMGFTVSSAALAASCEQPIQKAIPYLIKPEEVQPGKANYYATSFFDSNEYCSLVVKTRDGRPIKIEGNTLSPITRGGTSAYVQASVLSLYDDARYKGPKINGKTAEWQSVDNEIREALQKISSQNRKIALITPTIISPSTKKLIQQFSNVFETTEHIVYDEISYSGMLDANQQAFGRRVIPSYKINNAALIVSFQADFLGTWLSPVEFAKQYAQCRDIKKADKMIKHIQVESGMSLTGSNADYRYPAKPSDCSLALLHIYKKIAQEQGGGLIGNLPEVEHIDIDFIADQLIKNKSKSIVISASNSPFEQYIVNSMNYLLDNYSNTIDLENHVNFKQGSDEQWSNFVNEFSGGGYSAAIFYDVNPVYNWHEPEKIKQGLTKTECTVSISSTPNETSEFTKFVCPTHHFLESWNDAEPHLGMFSLAQPTIRPLFDTRMFQESLLIWSGAQTKYNEFVQEYWETELFPKQKEHDSFIDFWNSSLQSGIFHAAYTEDGQVSAPVEFNTANIQDYALKIAAAAKADKDSIELYLYEKTAIRNGKHANNPWLQELPDPVTKATWDNYACVSPSFAQKHQLEQGDYISLNSIKMLPVLIQPGQADNTISVALGYGRTSAGKVANNLGANAFQEADTRKGYRAYAQSCSLSKTGSGHTFALTQTHHSMEGRPIVRETTLHEYTKNPHAGNEIHEEHEKKHVTLYKKQDFKGHHWAMAIDLTKCTGCSNCAIACQAENNTPVIGKEQVHNRRIMHWMRIDRYYTGEPDNPRVVHQPVMCQHCDNAPCENVCPVSATMHSSEGLNQVVYNRCIGTKYCINNCPYRVRRFNWFEYANNKKFDFNQNSDLGKLVLNPDVVVRERGVVEKCSLCVQRIQEKKLGAKLENRQIKDGEVKPACVQSCPSDALVFGDLNDEKSRISKLFMDERNYHLLEELHTLPSIGYLTKVRNNVTEEKENSHSHS